MPAAPFVLFRDDPAGHELLFDRPHEIILADTPESFFPALDAMQAAHDAGKWLAGYFSYEAGYLLEPKLRPILPEGRRAPLICIGVFDGPSETDLASSRGSASNGPIFDARATWSQADYESRFAHLHRHLRLGDCYQGNLTFPIEAQWSGDPLAAFDALTERQPVKYGALVSLGNPVVLSRSPELFFQVDADGWIETHPMKGTTPRGKTPAEDEAQREFLRNDPKNQAENRMIVDLLRNDISLISEVGSLDVPELFKIETYPTLHTMVSSVRAKLLPDLPIARIFAALFPCGSITGAPKIRAMEILRELEGTPRDAYCGAIGWIAPSGIMRFSVAIRTISLYPDGEAIYNVGGGVVFDSTAQEEYAECLLKARFATGTPPASS
ncbi:aminodeoxychorismate synthase component I [Pseudaminobacter soli (ex Li et al. 2025)]|uniref:Aminodeoxychorismate synthase, component I n=1 Tax=Pseudaminobacter soli (ex Li et al. 2025) TaxID=1295366 RepID=A0A2P7SEG8_9HYPH|nr:aminodeoxychorismate synthase component I [Mesorhizobium soli]PSJ60863.1 aminodeoxychorismate synthase, component I [Mesorhizobium soli]